MDNVVEYNDESMENLHEIHINIDETAPHAELVGSTVDNVDIETGDVHAVGENVTGWLKPQT